MLHVYGYMKLSGATVVHLYPGRDQYFWKFRMELNSKKRDFNIHAIGEQRSKLRYTQVTQSQGISSIPRLLLLEETLVKVLTLCSRDLTVLDTALRYVQCLLHVSRGFL